MTHQFPARDKLASKIVILLILHLPEHFNLISKNNEGKQHKVNLASPNLSHAKALVYKGMEQSFKTQLINN